MFVGCEQKWKLTLAAFLFANISLNCTFGMTAKEPAEQAKLNVVFILADDLGWGEVGCFGQQKIPTPNIDRLASEGMRFTDHHSGAPVCAPSRCVLMTGKHMGHAEIRGNLPARMMDEKYTEGQFPLSQQAVTILKVFQQAGYATGAMGKWGLGPVGSTGDPNQHGLDLFFGYNCQSVAHSYYPLSLWRNDQKIVINPNPISGHQKPTVADVKIEDTIGETYAPKLMIAEAENFIAANKDKPFFLYLPFIEPHVAMHPPKESVQRFPEEWDREQYRGDSGYLPHPRPRAGYAAMISDLDSYVGRVLKSLEAAGLTNHTLVVFTSDNGTTHAGPPGKRFHVGGADPQFFNSTGGLRGYKGSVYEGGIRVPMIVRLPGKIPASSVNDSPSYFADWFPTLSEAAGLMAPANMDGESLWPTMTQIKSYQTHKPMVWVFPEYGGQVAVRLGEFKVIRKGLKTKSPGGWEVYNLAVDRGEEHNLASANEEIINQAKKVLREEVQENSRFPVVIPGINAK